MVSIFKDEEDYIIRCTKKVEDFFIKKKVHYEEQFHLHDYLLSFNFQKNRIHLTVEVPMIKENKDKERGLIVVQEVNLLKKVDKNVENLVRFMIEEKKKLFQDKSYLSSLIQDVFINRWVFIQECPICFEFNAHTRCDRCQFPICALCLNKFMTFENSEKIAKKFCQCNRNFLVFNEIPCNRLIINEANRNFSVFNRMAYRRFFEDKPLRINDLFYNHLNDEDTEDDNNEAEDTEDVENEETEDEETENEDTEDEETEDDETEDEETEDNDTDNNVKNSGNDIVVVNLLLRAVQNFNHDVNNITNENNNETENN